MVDRRQHGGASPVVGTCGVEAVDQTLVMEAESSRGGNRDKKNLGSRVGGGNRNGWWERENWRRTNLGGLVGDCWS